MRVWVAGCSSGEEAYSLAMLLMEEITVVRKNCLLQIFATDLDEEALEFARRGVYPESIAEDVGPERLSRFFIRKDQGFQVNELLRKTVVFALQNLITDPPFSRMDLISCRNLLIYLDADTQTRLIPLFSFALNPGGYLFLGKSEGISGHSDLFDTVSKKARLYRRLIPSRPIVLDSPILPGNRRVVPTAGPAAIKAAAPDLAEVIRRALLMHFAASVVLTDRKGQILQFHGQTGKYLNMPAAEPNLNLLEIAREGLSSKLRLAMHRALQEGRAVSLDSLPVTREQDSPFVRVIVTPISQRGGTEPLLAVIFEDIPRPTAPAAALAPGSQSDAAVKQLEDELRATQHELQATIEELQVSNEELRIANEEVISTNEELQSTVEELETSKEELQSVNEELTTVNSELQDKVERLDAANSDLANFLESTDIATLFLDSELQVKRFTPATTRVLKLIPTDIGRKISDLSMNFNGYELTHDVLAVARGAAPVEREVQHADGSCYLLRLLPYRTGQKIDGVVVTFSDITRLREAEKQTLRLATVLTDSNDAVILFDPAGNILTWNQGAQRGYGWSEAEAVRMTIYDLTPAGKTEEINNMIRGIKAGEPASSFETQRITKDGRVLDIWLTATAVGDKARRTVEAIATTERDITERKKMEESLKKTNAELEISNRELDAFIYSVSHDLQTPLRAISGFIKILYEDCAGQFDEECRDYLTRIFSGAERMSELIRDLLYLSRISRQDVFRIEFSISKKAASIIDRLREADAARSVDVSIKEGLVAFADPGLAEVILSSLLENAWKFTSRTENARIEVGALEQDGKTVFYVRDNGAGFDPAYMEKLFRPFHRLHSEEEFGGTGIGLAIAERVIRRHGGRVWAEGETGKGATFFFTLD